MARPKGTTKPEGLFLNSDQLKQLFNAIRRKKDLRSDLMFSLIFYFGLRVSELCSLKLTDVVNYSSPQEMTVTIQGMKGGRKRTYENLEPRLAYKLRKWILKEKDSDTPYLFSSRQYNGNPLSAQTIKILFKNYLKIAGLPHDYSVHLLRASCAVHLVQSGASVTEVMRWLRLRNIQNAQIYFDRIEYKCTESKVKGLFGEYL